MQLQFASTRSTPTVYDPHLYALSTVFQVDMRGVQDEQPGEFAKASEEVLQKRRIIKARRAGGGVASTQPAAAAANGAAQAEAPAAAAVSSNPFAGVSLLAKQPQVSAAAPSGV